MRTAGELVKKVRGYLGEGYNEASIATDHWHLCELSNNLRRICVLALEQPIA
jgi:hypothetical protein